MANQTLRTTGVPEDLADASRGERSSGESQEQAVGQSPRIERIARRAYDLYQQRGYDGGDIQDWLQAEREIDAQNENDENTSSHE
jgi:hypothetical protein